MITQQRFATLTRTLVRKVDEAKAAMAFLVEAALDSHERASVRPTPPSKSGGG